MRKRQFKKQFWFNNEEIRVLQQKAEQAKTSEAELIRNLIMGIEIKEKPDDRFYEEMKQMRQIGNNLNQIARKANALNLIEYPYYKKEAEKWNKFILDIKNKYLVSIIKK